ncbi:MAG: methyl-accepting chemotaxis protein [Spirochaetia bacterium]
MEFFSENLQSDSGLLEGTDLTSGMDNGKLDDQSLSQLALSIWGSFGTNFIVEKEKTAKNKVTAIEEEESLNRVADVISSIATLENIQTDLIKTIGDAGDLGSSVLKEVKDLRDFIAHISDSVKNINDIAERVHVLSLNAAIEAARAGERGKGFAVVSSEIRSLAGSTAQRVDEISEYIRQSASAVEKVVTGIQSTVSNVTSTHQQLAGSTEKIKSMETITTRAKEDMKKSQVIGLIENLRDEHGLLRVQAYQSLLKNLPLSEEKIPNAHNCALGRWYKENKGISAFSDLAIYQKLEAPHELFHVSIDQIREAISNNDISGITKGIEALESANKEISEILADVIKSIR